MMNFKYYILMKLFIYTLFSFMLKLGFLEQMVIKKSYYSGGQPDFGPC